MINWHKLIPYIIIAVLAAVLWFKGCEKETIKVKVPEVIGDFEPQKPEYIIEKDTVYITKWKTKTNTIEVPTKNPVNDSLVLAYQQAQDSLERFKQYLEAIQIRSFSNTFEDEYLDLTISGKVQGKLLSLKPDYKIKERTIETEAPTNLRLLAGFEIGNSTLFNDFRYKVNIGLQNASGNIYRFGYAKENVIGHYFWLGYDFSLLKF